MSAPLAYLIIFIGVLGHGSSEFFSVLTGLAGPETSVWRFMLGSFGLIIAALIFMKPSRITIPLKQNALAFIWTSLIGVTGTYLAFHIALDFASIVQVGTIITTIPIFVGLTDRMLNKVPISTPKLITGFAAILGIVLLVTDGYLATLLSGDARSLIGIGLSVICAFCGAAYVVLAKPLIAKHGSLPVTTITICMGTIGLWLIVGVGWQRWVSPTELLAMNAAQLWPLLTVGLWNTTITQLVWLAGLAAVPDITRGSYMFFLKPVITALLAYLFLSQTLTILQMAAITVICGAVVLEILWPMWNKFQSKADNAGV